MQPSAISRFPTGPLKRSTFEAMTMSFEDSQIRFFRGGEVGSVADAAIARDVARPNVGNPALARVHVHQDGRSVEQVTNPIGHLDERRVLGALNARNDVVHDAHVRVASRQRVDARRDVRRRDRIAHAFRAATPTPHGRTGSNAFFAPLIFYPQFVKRADVSMCRGSQECVGIGGVSVWDASSPIEHIGVGLAVEELVDHKDSARQAEGLLAHGVIDDCGALQKVKELAVELLPGRVLLGLSLPDG